MADDVNIPIPQNPFTEVEVTDEAPTTAMDEVSELLVKNFPNSPVFVGAMVPRDPKNLALGTTFMTFTNADIAQMGHMLLNVAAEMIAQGAVAHATGQGNTVN